MSLKKRLEEYVCQFNENDEEIFKTDVLNDDALDFLMNEIPRIEVPDKDIERTYYFRYWVYRKHIRKTPNGHIVTEFLPDVAWAGAYNSINCATPFHLLEGRWLKTNAYMEEYIDFFLDNIGNAFSYSMAFADAILKYASLNNRTEFLKTRYEKIKAWYEERLKRTPEKAGLYYSVDGCDGMEFGISGSGLRPTINSYIYADAVALKSIAEIVGKNEDAKKYWDFAQKLRERILSGLWNGDFFVTVPECCMEDFEKGSYTIPDAHSVRELIGYVPWMYGIPKKEHESAWNYIFSSFYTRFGLTTAEQQHGRYMEKYNHECLWNGPIWPFATSQVLTALAEYKRGGGSFSDEEYFRLLRDYAKSHRRTLEDGKEVDWIDENMSPDGIWLSRSILEKWGFPENKGGYERGKDYNHSMFCNLVLSDLLGIFVKNGELTVEPMIPGSWDGFKVENLNIGEKTYSISYTRTDGAVITEQ